MEKLNDSSDDDLNSIISDNKEEKKEDKEEKKEDKEEKKRIPKIPDDNIFKNIFQGLENKKAEDNPFDSIFSGIFQTLNEKNGSKGNLFESIFQGLGNFNAPFNNEFNEDPVEDPIEEQHDGYLSYKEIVRIWIDELDSGKNIRELSHANVLLWNGKFNINQDIFKWLLLLNNFPYLKDEIIKDVQRDDENFFKFSFMASTIINNKNLNRELLELCIFSNENIYSMSLAVMVCALSDLNNEINEDEHIDIKYKNFIECCILLLEKNADPTYFIPSEVLEDEYPFTLLTMIIFFDPRRGKKLKDVPADTFNKFLELTLKNINTEERVNKLPPFIGLLFNNNNKLETENLTLKEHIELQPDGSEFLNLLKSFNEKQK